MLKKKLLCHDIFPLQPASLESELHRERCYTQRKICYLPEALNVLLYALNMSLEVLTTCTVSEAWQRNITLPPRDCASGYENLHFQGSTVHGGSQNRSLINSSQRYNNALIHGWLLPQRLVEQAKAPAIIGHNSIKMVVQTFHCYWSESSLQPSGSRLHVPHFKHHPAQLLEGMSTGGRIGCISFLYYKYLVFGKSIDHVRWISYLLAYRNLYLCHNVNFWRCLSVLVSQPTRDHKHKNLNNSRQGVMQYSLILAMLEMTANNPSLLHCLFHLALLYERYQKRMGGIVGPPLNQKGHWTQWPDSSG